MIKKHLNLFKYVLAFICLAAIVGLSLWVGGDSQPVSLFGHRGSMQIEIADGQTEEPIAGATIVIPETKGTYVTGENGKTDVIALPLLEDDRFDKILTKPWGEVTLIIYKEGYTPYVLFYAQVWENQSRAGPKLYIFKDDGSSDPFSVIEGPQRLWVNELVEKYQP